MPGDGSPETSPVSIPVPLRPGLAQTVSPLQVRLAHGKLSTWNVRHSMSLEIRTHPETVTSMALPLRTLPPASVGAPRWAPGTRVQVSSNAFLSPEGSARVWGCLAPSVTARRASQTGDTEPRGQDPHTLLANARVWVQVKGHTTGWDVASSESPMDRKVQPGTSETLAILGRTTAGGRGEEEDPGHGPACSLLCTTALRCV